MANDSETGAILTPTQRDWLRGEEELSDAAERMTRSRIRTRVRTALEEDFPILREHLSEADRDNLVEGTKEEQEQLFRGTEDAIAFVYELHWAAPRNFSRSLLHGVRKAHNKNPRGVPLMSVDRREFEFDPGLVDPAEWRRAKINQAKQKMEDEEPLTNEEWRLVVENEAWPEEMSMGEFVEWQSELRGRARTRETFENITDRAWPPGVLGQDDEGGE